MRTVVENKIKVEERFSLDPKYSRNCMRTKERKDSCFYEYGVRNPVSFSGFEEGETSKFVASLGTIQ